MRQVAGCRRCAPVLRRYGVHGTRLRVEAESESLAQRFDEILKPFTVRGEGGGGFLVRMRYGNPRQLQATPKGMRLTWRGVPAGGSYTAAYASENSRRIHLPGLALVRVDLRRGEAQITVKPDEEWRLDRNCITPVLCEFFGRAGQDVVHAASLSADDRAVLLAGPSGAGKTTTALALARSGMRLMADDASFVGRDGLAASSKTLAVWGLPRPCRVHKKTLAMMPWLDGIPRRRALLDAEFLIDVTTLSPNYIPRKAKPGLILFLDRRNRQGHRLRPVDKVTALIRLARENLRVISPAAHGPAGRTFEMLAELVEQSDTFALSVGPRLDTLFDKIVPLLKSTSLVKKADRP